MKKDCLNKLLSIRFNVDLFAYVWVRSAANFFHFSHTYHSLTYYNFKLFIGNSRAEKYFAYMKREHAYSNSVSVFLKQIVQLELFNHYNLCA